MSSVRGDLELIVSDSKYAQLFEEKLKKSYSFQNIAFWTALRNLRLSIEAGEDISSAPLQEAMEFIARTYIDTESSQSIALSFKAKERFKRAKNQPADEVKRAINQAQLEVEMLLVSEVKAFLAEAPPPSAAQKSPRMTSPAATPRPPPDAVAKTRDDRSQSEFVGPPSNLGSPGFRSTVSNVPATNGGKAKDAPRSYSVSSNAPPKAAQKAVQKGGSGAMPAPLASSPAGSAGGSGSIPSSPSPGPAKSRTSYFDVAALEGVAPPRSGGAMDLKVFTWGDNLFNQLGFAGKSEAAITLPTALAPSVSNVVFVQCSDSYTVLVDANGQAYCAGKLCESETFVPILDGYVVRQVGCGLQFCIALLDTGRLLYFGANRAIEKLPLAENVSKIVCGARHCVALTTTGNVYTWGSDEKKQLGHNVAERVPKPKQLAGLTEIIDIAAGKNSSACISLSGVVSAWGAVVNSRPEIVPIEELKGKGFFRVACSDKFLACVTDLGRLFVWHPDAVPDVGIVAATPNPCVALRSVSVFQVSCTDHLIVALTDSGELITWGDYASALGQGGRVSYKRYADTPRRLPELLISPVRRASCSDVHVVASIGETASSKREELLWELYSRERQYGRILYAMVDEYSRRIKIKDTPVFKQAGVLQDHHMSLLREFSKALEFAPRQALVEVGVLYSTCLSIPEVAETYRSWSSVIAAPLEKLGRPKLAAQLADIELEVEFIIKKTDSASEANRSFNLLSIMKEPNLYLQSILQLLNSILSVTPGDSADQQPLQRAVQILSNLTGQAAPALPASFSSNSNSAAASPVTALRSMGQSLSALEPLEEQMQDRLRFRALKTELEIFQDANVQLVRYALALEQMLLQKGGPLTEGSSSGNRELPQIEEELVELSRENAELKARLKMSEIYKAQFLELTGTGAAHSSTPSSDVESDDRPTTPTKAVTMSSSGSILKNRTLQRKVSGVSSSASLRTSTVSSITDSPSASGGGGGNDDSKDYDALRQRINPAAGRLLSEGEGAAARSLEQFTFDDVGSKQSGPGVVYSAGELKAATLEKLLEFLTQSSGSLALDTFLISYRNFASPQDILRRLVYMYCVAPGNKSKVVWVRLLNFLKSWVVKFFEEDWENNAQLRAELFSFLDDIVGPSSTNSTAVSTVNTIRERFAVKSAERQMSQRILVPPRPSGPLNLGAYKPSVIAEQLTISEHEVFRSIKPGECFNQNWMKKGSGLSVNIVNLINRFNRLSRWASYEICQIGDVKDRRLMVEKFISVAQVCREIRAYGIVMAIMGALSSTPVFRLKKTWEGLSRASQTTYNELKELVSSEGNFSNLREATKIAELPCFPYIGTYLGDLTFIDAGAKDYTPEGLINWSKFQATANSILQLQAKQKTRYSFDAVSEWQAFLHHLPDHSENEVFELSKKVEPTTGSNK